MSNEPNMTNERDDDDIPLSALPSVDDAPDAPDAAPLSDDVAPKRRGRPRGSKNILDAVAGGARRAGKAASATVVKQQVAMFVGLGNVFVSQTRWRDDCLNEGESTLATNALSAELMTSKRIVGWMMAASGVTPHLLVLQAAVIIATPRLRRRGLLPSAFGASKDGTDAAPVGQFGEPLSAEAEAEAPSDYSPIAFPVEAGGAPIPFGGYGER